MSKLTTLCCAAAVTLALGGCAIQPKPLAEAASGAQIRAEIDALFQQQAPIEAPVGLYEAMARAIKYNLDHRVKLMENALAQGELAAARYDLLPQLTAQAGYRNRNNESGSSSRSLLTGEESLEPSTSVEKERNTADATLAWNILDFGVSYAQAQQRTDGILISLEKRRKVLQNIIEDVRYAYWRAASAQTLLPELSVMDRKLTEALKRVDQLEDTGILPPLTYLNYRKELLETSLEMWQLREELLSAQSELAALINLPPGRTFELKVPPESMRPTPVVALSLPQLEEHALAHRPELLEEQYQTRISRLEVRKAMLRMLPGLEIDLSANYDSNRFLYNNSWSKFGVRVSWNLFNLFSGPKQMDLAEAQLAVDEARTKALAMAVLTQVHLGRLRFEIAKRDFELTDQLSATQLGISGFMQSSQQARIESELQVVRSGADALLARMNRDLSYAELQNAYGSLQTSIGVSPLPLSLPDHDLKTIAGVLEDRLQAIGE